MTGLLKRYISLILFVSCGECLLLAQLPDYHIQIFDERFGIRTDMERIVKDNSGFVWVMYPDRIQRFDGKNIDEFPVKDRLNSMIVDENNKVWLSSNSHVYRFENNKKGFIELEIDSADKLKMGAVFQMPGRGVWLVTDHGFYSFDPIKSKFLSVTDLKLKTKTPVNTRRLCFNLFENTFFYSSKDSVWSVDAMTGSHQGLPGRPSAIFPINKFQVVVTNWKSQAYLYDYEKQTIQIISPEKFLKQSADNFLTISAVLNLNEHQHLLATSKGLLEFNSSHGTFIPKQLYYKGQPLSNGERIADIIMDDHKNIWACSQYNLMTFDPDGTRIGLIRNKEVEPSQTFSNQIRHMAADDQENLWLATTNGITYWDIKKNKFYPVFAVEGAKDRMNHPSIRGISFDGENVIIGQTNRGIWLYDPVKKTYRRPLYEARPTGESIRKKLEMDFIDQIYKLENGNHFIVARDRGYVMEAKSSIIRHVPFPGSKENLNFCYQDDYKQVWIGTHQGLYCLDSNLVYKFAIKENIGDAAIRSLYQWDDNEYILGTQGLYSIQVKSGKTEISKLAAHFDGIFINTIYRDHSDRLWLGTDEGLFCYNRQTGYVESFDRFDNIQGDVFYPNSAHVNSDGMLFMGGTNGINYFYPDQIQIRKDSLKVSLVSVIVNQDDSSYYHRAGLLSLKPFQNSIGIEYIAPYFGNTKKLQYRYQLEGLNSNWYNVGTNNILRFSSLRPGSYTFRVAASLNGIEWIEGNEALPFNIAYPFWQKWWFIALSAIVILCTIYLLVKQRIKFVRRQEAEKRQSEVQLITMNRDLAASQLTALRAQMNPHFIFNALNSVQRYVLKGDIDQANKYLSKFSRLQREVLNNSNQDFITLEREMEILELYLELEQLRFDDRFAYTITVDKNIETSEIKIPPMILQPFVENAIWHGLMPHSGPKKLDIQFLLDSEEILFCRIVDNGIGRAASARLKNNHDGSTPHQAKGQSLVHERLSILEQLYQHPYQVEVIDKTDPSGAIEGTEVNLTLHVGR